MPSVLTLLGAGTIPTAAGGASFAFPFSVVANHATAATTASSDTTGITCLVIICHYTNGGFTSIADSKGNTWSALQAEGSDAGMGAAARTYICESPTVGTGHTFTLTAGDASIYVVGITGEAASSLDQATTINFDDASPFTSDTTGTTAQNDEILIGWVESNAGSTETLTAGGSFAPGDKILETTDSTYWTGAVAAKIVASTGTFATSWTLAIGNKTLNGIFTIKKA